MQAYQYRAIDRNGTIHKGIAVAISTADLETRLTQLGLELITCRKQRAVILSRLRNGISRRDLIIFCYHMEQNFRVGVPILESLSDLRDTPERTRLGDIAADMIVAIEGGRTLAEAMQDHPTVFNGIFCSLVRAGELSGEMAEVFYNLGENLKWLEEQTALIKKLLTYPLLVGTVVLATIVFLVIYLVPEMMQFLRVMGQEMPFHTRVLVLASDILLRYWYLFLSLPILFTAALYTGVIISPSIQYYVDAIKLRLPLIGSVYKKIIIARLARFMAIMYASGITIIECIQAGEKIAGNRIFENAMHHIGQSLIAGESLGRGFAHTQVFPSMALRMISVGENTGTLEKSLLGISYFYTRDARESIDRLQSMIEPTMTLLLGSIIGWVMFSILVPIYDLITHVRI